MKTRLNDEPEFAVEKLSAALTFNDLVVNEDTAAALGNLKKRLMRGKSDDHITRSDSGKNKGSRVVFCGPSGTGKTLAATILAQEAEMEIYRIGLASVVSKYIGETEKNLSKLFAVAKSSDVVLFFDEADALFGKRTEVKDAHDRYANQETSWLLQKIEGYDGLVILSCNNLPDPDSPLLKTTDMIVRFEKPVYNQRLKLWMKYLPAPLLQEMESDVDDVARNYELTGGEIVDTINLAVSNNRGNLSKGMLLKELQAIHAPRKGR